MGITEIWTSFFLQPMVNSLIGLYSLLFNNFALSIAVFTIVVRLITLPLTIPQMTSSKKMQSIITLLELQVLNPNVLKSANEEIVKSQRISDFIVCNQFLFPIGN